MVFEPGTVVGPQCFFASGLGGDHGRDEDEGLCSPLNLAKAFAPLDGLISSTPVGRCDAFKITCKENKKTAYFTLFALVVLAGSAGCALGGFDPEKIAKYFIVAGGVAAGLGVIRLSYKAGSLYQDRKRNSSY